VRLRGRRVATRSLPTATVSLRVTGVVWNDDLARNAYLLFCEGGGESYIGVPDGVV
jgi:hypothetical protein